MFLSFYKLQSNPFKTSSDPKFLWMGEQHQEALATLKYGISDNKGFLLLTGDVGSGKTTLIHELVNSLDTNVIVGVISNPALSQMNFFNHIGHLFNFKKVFESKGKFITYFSIFLHEAYKRNKKILLIIDEAQKIPTELLEEVRLLSNIEKQNRKLLNIFFVGQNEFNEILFKDANKALRQRMALNYQIKFLSSSETAQYIFHRLKVAGGRVMLFNDEAVSEIHSYSGGSPRLINIVCDLALLTGYVKDKEIIGVDIIKECAKELSIPLGMKSRGLQTPGKPDAMELLQQAKQVKKMPSFKKTLHFLKPFPMFQKPPQQNIIYLLNNMKDAEENNDNEAMYVQTNSELPMKIEHKSVFRTVFRYAFAVLLLMLMLLAYEMLFHPYVMRFLPDLAGFQEVLNKENSTGQGINNPAPGSGSEGAQRDMPVVTETVSPDSVENPGQSKASQAGNADQTGSGIHTLDRDSQKGLSFNITASTIGKDETLNSNISANSDMIPPSAISSPAEQTDISKQGIKEGRKKEITAVDIEPAYLNKTETIVFTLNSNDLSNENQKKIIKLADFLMAHRDRKINITGHTDSIGAKAYNIKLSKSRADIVKNLMIGRGAEPDQLIVKGIGGAEPVADNSTFQGRMKNRRVELKFINSDE